MSNNGLSGFGFIPMNIPDSLAESVENHSRMISEKLSIDPFFIGSGAMITRGGGGTRVYSGDANQLTFNFEPGFSPTAFMFTLMWATATLRSGWFGDFSDQVRNLVFRECSQEEARQNILAKWKSAEISIQELVDSIVNEASAGDPVLAASVREASSFVSGVEGSMLAFGSNDSGVAIRKMRDGILAGTGFDIGDSRVSMLISPMGIRSDALGEVSRLSSESGRVYVMRSYFERISVISNDVRHDELMALAPAVALATFVDKPVPGEVPEQLVMTEAEIEEIAPAVIEFAESMHASATPSSNRMKR